MRFLIVLLTLITPFPAIAADYLLSIEGVQLGNGKRIAALRLELANGSFTAVSTIPADWWVQVEPAPRARLEMGAVHGVGFLDDLQLLRNVVRLSADEAPAVQGSLLLYITTSDQEREVVLAHEQIQLVKVDANHASAAPR
jgi:hypothetical protein